MLNNVTLIDMLQVNISEIIEIIEFGFPKSLVQRKGNPISELIDTELLRLEINTIIEGRISVDKLKQAAEVII